MTQENVASNRRILIVDDNPEIHGDFKKILATEPETATALQEHEALLFGPSTLPPNRPKFTIDSAQQGQERAGPRSESCADWETLCAGVRGRPNAPGLGRHRNNGTDLANLLRPSSGHLHCLLRLLVGQDSRATGPDRFPAHPQKTVRCRRSSPAGLRPHREMASKPVGPMQGGGFRDDGRETHRRTRRTENRPRKRNLATKARLRGIT